MCSHDRCVRLCLMCRGNGASSSRTSRRSSTGRSTTSSTSSLWCDQMPECGHYCMRYVVTSRSLQQTTVTLYCTQGLPPTTLVKAPTADDVTRRRGTHGASRAFRFSCPQANLSKHVWDVNLGFRHHCAGRADGVDAVPEMSAGSEHRGSHGEPLAPQVNSCCAGPLRSNGSIGRPGWCGDAHS